MLKVIVVLVLLACIAPFFIPGPDGRPLVTIERLLGSAGDAPAAAGAGEPPTATTVYKWQDAEGTWHFSDREADSLQAGAETLQLDGTLNRMDAYQEDPSATQATQDPASESRPLVPTIGAGLETLNQARELQATVDSRKEDIDKALRDAGG